MRLKPGEVGGFLCEDSLPVRLPIRRAPLIYEELAGPASENMALRALRVLRFLIFLFARSCAFKRF
jgi:hypothetical protein